MGQDPRSTENEASVPTVRETRRVQDRYTLFSHEHYLRRRK